MLTKREKYNKQNQTNKFVNNQWKIDLLFYDKTTV